MVAVVQVSRSLLLSLVLSLLSLERVVLSCSGGGTIRQISCRPRTRVFWTSNTMLPPASKPSKVERSVPGHSETYNDLEEPSTRPFCMQDWHMAHNLQTEDGDSQSPMKATSREPRRLLLVVVFDCFLVEYTGCACGLLAAFGCFNQQLISPP